MTKPWYHELSKRAQTALVDEFTPKGELTKEVVIQCIRAGRLRVVAGLGAKTVKEICDFLSVYPPSPDPLAKHELNGTHWTNELSTRARHGIIGGFYNEPLESITKERVINEIKAGTLIKFLNLGKITFKEICDYLKVEPEQKPTVLMQKLKTVYLIEKVWIDDSENTFEKALGYAPHGFMTNKVKVQAYVKAAGFKKGTGWPIPNDQEVPVMKFTEIHLIE